MKRRKFVLGLGSLAAGGAVTMGTGALSAGRAQRGVRGQVVGDLNAYLKINGSGNVPNGFVVENEGEEVVLDFDGDHSSSIPQGDGLNADAISWFDQALRLQNRGGEEMEVWIEENLNRIDFYLGAQRGTPFNQANAPSLPPYDGTNAAAATTTVGIKVDTRGITNPQPVFGQGEDEDEFVVVADTP